VRAKYYREKEPSREPEAITDLLGDIIASAGEGAGADAATLIGEWETVVSERWRRGTRPVGIRRGVLLVEVRSAADATLLRYDTADLLRRVGERFGPGLVSGVKLRVSHPRRHGENR
jgi:predicted nucleic acid-binding Zn ribbon protein